MVPPARARVTFTETLPANTTVGVAERSRRLDLLVGTLTCTHRNLRRLHRELHIRGDGKPRTSLPDPLSLKRTQSPQPPATPTPATTTRQPACRLQTRPTYRSLILASPVPVLAGANISYTQVVTNGGPSTATAARFTETTPPNTTFVQSIAAPAADGLASLPIAGTTGTITCTNPSFAARNSQFPVVVKVNAGTAAGTAINDIATVNSSTTDPNPANNSAIAADVVATATQADLITTNSAAANFRCRG